METRYRLRGAVCTGVAGAVLLCAAAAGASAADPAAELAARYAPVVRLVAQTTPCTHGEPYDPAPVGVVLANAEVALRGPWGDGNVVKIAPTEGDLSQRLTGYHLDFPGDALNPG